MRDVAEETPEKILEEARRYEKIATGAEHLRVKMRLGEKVYEEKTTVTRRLIFRDSHAVQEDLLTYGEDTALYRALGIVRDEAQEAAHRLRARVTLDGPDA